MNNYSERGSLPRLRVGVVGASGYAGCELLNRLARHPGVELVAAMTSGRAPAAESGPTLVADLAPAYRGRTGLACAPASIAGMRTAGAEFVFLATPPEVSSEWVAGLQAGGTGGAVPRIVDLSGAFRFSDTVVYGWPEKNRAAIRGAGLVSNPGCYATAALTALWPLLAGGLIDPAAIVCDAKSGVSGAGKGVRPDLQFAELEGNCKAYSLFTHRHGPEIARHAGFDPAGLIFTPHLLPTTRGILATLYVRPRAGGDGAEWERALAAAYAQAYVAGDHPFVRVRGARLPELRDVVHTNFCDVGWSVRADGQAAILVACLDNLVKGAAGQALQNFNLMTGWPEETALL